MYQNKLKKVYVICNVATKNNMQLWYAIELIYMNLMMKNKINSIVFQR